MAPSLKCRPFGNLPDGQSVEAWTFQGSGGLILEAITYGGIVTRLWAPDRKGNLSDVVLGFDNLESYLAGHPYFGAIIGRVAGRTSNARFSLENKTYELEANDPPNHLHGGRQGFDRKLWTANPLIRKDKEPALQLCYHSPDGEEGYPGAVDVSVTYTITSDNTFWIETEATTDRPTPFCLTHHSYFNLAGENSGTIESHILQIESESFAPVNDSMTLLGQQKSVIKNGNDFRQPVPLGNAIPYLFHRHGDLYFLSNYSKDSNTIFSAAQLIEPVSGRRMKVLTNEPCLQLYTGISLDGSLAGKSGYSYYSHAGICLECQGYSDAANSPSLDNIILRPGDIRRRNTAYIFSTS